MSGVGELMRACVFAAEKHRTQRRKDDPETPYINHPLGVAAILADECNVRNLDTIVAAVLHDVLEDTDTTVIFFFFLLIEFFYKLFFGHRKRKSKNSLGNACRILSRNAQMKKSKTRRNAVDFKKCMHQLCQLKLKWSNWRTSFTI